MQIIKTKMECRAEDLETILKKELTNFKIILKTILMVVNNFSKFKMPIMRKE